ncbi:MAG: MMPL family transporter [Desulfuromonas sp.]|nr:MMPL family transporter [Desulfuromonas sp.]
MLARLYSFFSRRRKLLVLGYGCFVLLGILCFSSVVQEENIEALLPDTAGTTVRRDFALLQHAPFARKVLIDLHTLPAAEGGLSGTKAQQSAQLKQVAIDLSRALRPPLFTQALYAPPLQSEVALDQTLLQALPNLVTVDDLVTIEQRLGEQQIDKQLQWVRNQLLMPQGWWTKQSLRSDPLQLWQIAAGHLRQLNPMSKSDHQQSDFVSQDGTHRLVVVDTDISISDVAGSRRMMEQLQQHLVSIVPASIKASVVSGHLYTLANADSVQRDLRLVLGTATVAILLIFFLLLRSWRALFVFILPASVLGYAVAAVAVFFPTVSGITIGFGAVLLGVTVDFTLHVYFSLRASSEPLQQLRSLTTPLMGSALTSFLAFSILLMSALPGQRQLAIFSMTAIALALLLAVVVMPHLCGAVGVNSSSSRTAGVEQCLVTTQQPGRLWVLVWLVVMLACAGALPRLHFDGAMRSLSVATPELRHNEELLQQVWGNMRSSALLFATGATFEDALQVNDQISQRVHHICADTDLVSLAAILPSQASQRHSREIWHKFWDKHSGSLQTQLASAGAKYGFSPQAFAPFIQWLPREVPPTDLAVWQRVGLAPLLNGLIVPRSNAANEDKSSNGDGHSAALISLIDEAALTPALQQSIASIDGAVVVAQSEFSRQLSAELATDFGKFISVACAVVVLVLILWYRRWRHVVLALLPVVSGLLFMFGTMSWLGLSFNLFNVIAAILIIGLGVDYGIFILSLCDGSGCQQSRRAVLVSALTTMAGFGALVLAHHPAMNSIGVTVLLGISAAVTTALSVVPVCYRWLVTA